MIHSICYFFVSLEYLLIKWDVFNWVTILMISFSSQFQSESLSLLLIVHMNWFLFKLIGCEGLDELFHCSHFVTLRIRIPMIHRRTNKFIYIHPMIFIYPIFLYFVKLLWSMSKINFESHQISIFELFTWVFWFFPSSSIKRISDDFSSLKKILNLIFIRLRNGKIMKMVMVLWH